ncbi:phosphatidylinositol-specific phospholipase C/glycerophosphodiester phosphodiesterase family protein [Negadavirga shengliensis]|uniref:Altered inheritance of mitochondria protein 6 n=1 Tax=Negadavirga shengliensis TaxID=1389218 RepID=A0ABV9SXT9_9BACT
MVNLNISRFLAQSQVYTLVIFIIFLSSLHVPVQAQTFKVHSHNDYIRNIPFWEAYANNVASIEVDVILKDDKLYVAHEEASIHPRRTLESLYLEPIQKARDLNIGHLNPFILLIDFKTEAHSTLEKLLEVVEPYREICTAQNGEALITLVISGNRPEKRDYIKFPSYILFDYQSVSDTSDLPLDKIAMISLNFRHLSSWDGKDEIDENEKIKLLEAINIAHSLQKPIRFWATPDTPAAWLTLHEMGVDYINTDDPYGATQYLSRKLVNH